LTAAARQQVLAQVQPLDPIGLAREIDQALHVLWKLADRPRSLLKEAARG
jgi:hypothetical protein